MFYSVSFADIQSAYLNKAFNPFSHNYIQTVLTDVRGMKKEAKALPSNVLPLIPRFEYTHDHIADNSLSLSLISCVSYFMVEAGLTDWDEIESTFSSFLRLNFIFGNLYQSPFYVRCGYDYLPFGYHVSEAMAPEHIITRSILDQKDIVLEIGSAFKGVSNQLQVALAFFIPEPLIGTVIMNIQYNSYQSRQLARFCTVKNYKLGGGFGIGGREPIVTDEPGSLSIGFLFNTYGSIDFHKRHHFQWEFIYNNLFTSRYSSRFGSNLHLFCPHSLHIEWSKPFIVFDVARWRIPSMFILGYEWGSRPIKKTKHLQSNFFGAWKVGLWKHHVTMVLGSQKNIVNQNGFQHFFRVSVAF